MKRDMGTLENRADGNGKFFAASMAPIHSLPRGISRTDSMSHLVDVSFLAMRAHGAVRP